MSKLRQEIPSYLRAEYQLIATVTFTAFFSLLFMLFSIPFSHNAWFELGASEAFGYSVCFYVIGLVVIILSKRVMYLTRDKWRLDYLRYILWNLSEVVIICLLYTIFTIEGNKLGIIRIKETSFVNIFLNALLYCFTSLVVPYVIAGMYFTIIDKNNTIRLMNYSNVVSDEPKKSGDSRKITLFDNSGAMNLSISLSNLYLIESDDNYIRAWYTDSNAQMQKYYLRCRLKTAEESFEGSSMVRCHRKYIVNIDKVRTILKEKNGCYSIELSAPEIPVIPVSKTYEQAILQHCKREEA